MEGPDSSALPARPPPLGGHLEPEALIPQENEMNPLGEILSIGLVIPLFAGGALAEIEEQTITYSVEYGGKLCGYSQFHLSGLEKGDRDLLLLEQKMYVMLSLLGAEFNSEFAFTYHIDPATGGFVYHDSRLRQGDVDLGMALFIEDGVARMTTPDSDEETVTPVTAGAILPNTLLFPHLYEDFVVQGLEKKTYDVFEVRAGAVQQVVYKKVGEDRLELSGKTYETIALVEENSQIGSRVQRWLNRANGHIIKTVQPNGMVIALADASVIGLIELANIDESILTPTNVTISNLSRIRFMRVKAVLEPTGLRLTPEDLTVPGQTFEGTVKGNRVEGIFEVSHPLYDGVDAPPFPMNWADREDLAPFLAPEDFIEADDPILVEAAREIVKGATDSWDAASRIGRWVADNIHGAIPGGVTARKTFDLRNGECSAHSFLTAALCRAVGIPARAVWGCMYAPMQGGCFGQHVWNEVFMGDEGWISLDTTVKEATFIDSGHIRIGVYQSMMTGLNGKSFEILDHILADD